MKVLITGGAGYVGTELSYQLATNKNISEIIIYDNLSRPNYNLFIGKNKLQHAKLKFVHGDILDSRKVKQLLRDIDVVYHLAAKVTTPFSDQNPHFFEQINHWGTAELVYAVEESNVSKFIYLSSASVYGAGNEMKDIDTPPNPRTYYGISKLRGEEHVQRLSDKISAFTIRCGNVYGYSKSMRFDAVINKFMFDANFYNKITIHGNGEQKRSFIHIENAVSCLASFINSSLSPTIYNMVDSNLTINQIAEPLREVFPGLETLYVNQHFNFRELQVLPDARLSPFMKKNQKELTEELMEFKDNFTF